MVSSGHLVLQIFSNLIFVSGRSSQLFANCLLIWIILMQIIVPGHSIAKLLSLILFLQILCCCKLYDSGSFLCNLSSPITIVWTSLFKISFCKLSLRLAIAPSVLRVSLELVLEVPGVKGAAVTNIWNTFVTSLANIAKGRQEILALLPM